MGDAGHRDATAAARFGSRWTYAGQGGGSRPDAGGADAQEFRFDARIAATRLFGVVSRERHAFAVAGDAQRRVRGGRHRRRVRAALRGRFRRLRDVRDGDGRRGRERDDSVQARRAARRRRRADADRGRSARPTPCGGVAGHGRRPTPTSTGFLAPLRRLRASCEGARAAVLGAGGAARAVVVALVSRGARVTVHARRQEQAAEWRATLGAAAGGWPPPRRLVGSAGELHAARRAGAARRVAAAGRPVRRAAGLRPHLRFAANRGCLREARAPDAGRSTACRCSWRRRSGSSSGGPERAAARRDAGGGERRAGMYGALARDAAAPGENGRRQPCA